MNPNRGYVLGPEARVVVLRRHDGYGVAVVHSEGPFTHEQAEAMAAALRRQGSGKLTKAEAAQILGITEKGVDYLRAQGVLKYERQSNKRVLIDSDSVHEELARRGA
jgi:hypothetical protein